MSHFCSKSPSSGAAGTLINKYLEVLSLLTDASSSYTKLNNELAISCQEIAYSRTILASGSFYWSFCSAPTSPRLGGSHLLARQKEHSLVLRVSLKMLIDSTHMQFSEKNRIFNSFRAMVRTGIMTTHALGFAPFGLALVESKLPRIPKSKLYLLNYGSILSQVEENAL